MTPIRLAEELQAHVRLEALDFDAVRVRSRDDGLVRDLEQAAELARRAYAAIEVSAISSVRDVRQMYHATGTDPTKRRPSSEALLRRALQHKPLPQINTLVDCINLFSLRELVPVGLYDRVRIHGSIECRLGFPSEPYAAIGREEFGIAGRLVLADELGAFGSPTSDSTRTMVTLETTAALVIVFWPAGRVTASARLLSELAQRYCSAE